jgi:hypothetical protein
VQSDRPNTRDRILDTWYLTHALRRGQRRGVSWNEFFNKFDEKNLAFLYQEKTATGKPSRFFKLISRDKAKSRGK